MPYQTRMYAEGSDQLLKLRNWKIRMTSKGGVFIWYSLVALHFLCGSRTKAKGCFKVEDFNDQILLGQSPCKKVLWSSGYKTQSEICDIFCHLLSQYKVF